MKSIRACNLYGFDSHSLDMQPLDDLMSEREPLLYLFLSGLHLWDAPRMGRRHHQGVLGILWRDREPGHARLSGLGQLQRCNVPYIRFRGGLRKGAGLQWGGARGEDVEGERLKLRASYRD